VNLYGIIPPPASTYNLDDETERLAVLEALQPPGGPWVRAALVTTSAGEIWGNDGTSASLTRGVDRTLLGLHRQVVDAVVVGATTVTHEPVPLPISTPLVVVTASGNLQGHQLSHTERGEVVVVTSAEGATRVGPCLGNLAHRVVVLEDAAVFSPEAVVAGLTRALGAQSFLIEGGRVLFETFASITDEVALSVTPPPRSERAGIPQWWPDDTETWSLTSLMTDDEQMLYYTYLTGVRGAPS